MRKIFLLVISGISLILVSCGSVSKTGYVAPFARTEVYTDSIKADLELSQEKVNAKASSWYFLWVIKVAGDSKFTEAKNSDVSSSIFGNRVNEVRSAALYNALQTSGADMLVTPQYDTETKSYLFGILKSYKVKVNGYQAKIKKLYQVK